MFMDLETQAYVLTKVAQALYKMAEPGPVEGAWKRGVERAMDAGRPSVEGAWKRGVERAMDAGRQSSPTSPLDVLRAGKAVNSLRPGAGSAAPSKGSSASPLDVLRAAQGMQNVTPGSK